MKRIGIILAILVLAMAASPLQAAVLIDVEGIAALSTIQDATFSNLDASPPTSTSVDLVPTGTFSATMDGSETFYISITAVNDWNYATATSSADINAYIAGLMSTNFNGNNTGWGVYGGGSDVDLDNAGEAFVITFDLSGLSAEHQEIFWMKSIGGERIHAGDIYNYAAIDVSANAVSAAMEGQVVELDNFVNVAIGDGDQFVFGHDAGMFRIAGLTVDVVEPVLESTVSLNPSDELSMALVAPSSTTNATVDVSYSYGAGANDVEISSVVVANQTHPGAFSCLETVFPVSMTNPLQAESFTIEFDNSIAGFTANGETSTGTVVVTWNEVGDATPYTEEVLVTLLFSAAETELVLEPFSPNRLFLLGPATSMAMSIVAPALSADRDMEASYIADVWAPTNVVITGVEFANTTHAGFSSPDTFPMTLAYPPPTNASFNIAFDGSEAGLANGESATGNVVVAWSELGSAVTNQMVFPVLATYVVLEPVTGTIVELGTNMPLNNIVLKAEPELAQTPDILRVNEFDGGYTKVGQEIQVTELDGDETSVDSLLLKVAHDFDFTQSSGAHQIQIWFGRIVSETGAIVENLATETFDCAGRAFTENNFLQFNLSSAINFDPANLAAGESYAFELWWTTDDPENFMDFWRGGVDIFDGGLTIVDDLTATDTTFPVVLDSLNDNRVFVFAFASGLGGITEISDVQIGSAGGDVVLSWEGVGGASYAVQRKTDLVLGTWSNVVEGVTGTDVISVTNGTTEPQAFYRTILE